MPDRQPKISVHGGAAALPAAQWNACANPPGLPYNPFLDQAFFKALEASGSATRQTGWMACHITLDGPDDQILGLMPCYLKSHSQGEYVFDWGWADAYERAGGSYYPKLQASVPFTPATGPRLLVPPGPQQKERRGLLLAGARALCSEAEASSVHITFLTEDEWREFGGKDWLQRTDTQFHWHNQGYVSFDDFLATLSHNHRKNLRKERRAIAESGISIEWVTGSEISESHWDAFFDFYMDTGSRKWGTPYLTREFFSLIGAAMPQNILLVMCKRAGRYIAGALNFIGSDTLYGRNWGALEHHPFLHFEACYYQAIDFAIARGLKTVEAGAQGAHKLARGYLPATTYSLHHLADPRLARAIADYLAREREAVADNQAELDALSPFRKPSA